MHHTDLIYRLYLHATTEIHVLSGITSLLNSCTSNIILIIVITARTFSNSYIIKFFGITPHDILTDTLPLNNSYLYLTRRQSFHTRARARYAYVLIFF